MNVSSEEIIDEVAAKLKYYMEVKRREDGFDLSGPNEPRRAYPHLKNGSSLSYAKLQDRSLKHYFTPCMIKTQIANLEAAPPGSPRQRTVQKKLKRKMRPYSQKNDFASEVMAKSRLEEDLYSIQMEALSRLHSETQTRLKHRMFSGTPVLRRSVAPKMTHGETVRLINRSSQILVATETVSLAHDIISQRHGMHARPQSAPANRSTGLPGLYDNRARPQTSRGRHGKTLTSTPKSNRRKPKYAWDINGRRIPYSQFVESIEDDPSSSCSLSSTSVPSETYYSSKGRRHRDMRPMSAMALPHKAHVGSPSRPYSAGPPRTRERRRYIEAATRKAVSPDSGFSVDAETQTKRHRRPPDRARQAFISGSEKSSDNEKGSPVQLCKYLVEIQTGDRLGAGTTADIYLSLHGDKGETDEIYLTNPVAEGNKGRPFKRGQVYAMNEPSTTWFSVKQANKNFDLEIHLLVRICNFIVEAPKTDTFEIEAENVGILSKIGIGHDQKEKGFSWFVNYVHVGYGEHSCKFLCKAWFSSSFSQRKTFRYITLDHDPSESSDSTSSDESSSSEISVENSKQIRKKIPRRKTSSSSEASKSSFRSQSSRSSSSKQSVKEAEKITAPTFQLVVTPTEETNKNQPEFNAAKAADIEKNSVEYSSDSSDDSRRKRPNADESFVEESEDTQTVRSSSTSSDDSQTEEENDVTLTKTEAPTTNSSPFSLPNFLGSVIKSSSDSDSSTSTEKSFSISQSFRDEKKEQKSFIPSFSSSDSSSSSSDNEEADHAPLGGSYSYEKKRLSIAESIPITIESASQVRSQSRLSSASVEEVEEPVMEEAVVNNQEVLEASSRSSQSSESDCDGSSSTNEPSSDITQVSSIEQQSEETKMSFAKSETETAKTTEDTAAPNLNSVDREDFAKEKKKEVDEVQKQEALVVQPPSPRTHFSSSSSSSDSEAEDVHGSTEKIEEKSDRTAGFETDDSTKEFNAAALLDAYESTVRRNLNSSSSSSDSEDEVKEKLPGPEEASHLTTEDEIQGKADAFIDGFNAGIAASQSISATSPSLFEENMIKKQEIDESLQSDEEGIVRSPRQPSVRGDIHDLIKEGDLAKVMEIVSLRPELKEKVNEKGWSPIHVAATAGKLDILKWLVSMDVNLKAETATGYTAMHMAAMHGHVSCIMVLHAMGGDLDATNVDEQTPLHLACMSGHLETAKWLVANRAGLDAQDSYGRTAFNLAKQYHHKEVAQFLSTCMHDLQDEGSSMAQLQSTSKTSMSSSQHHSSSSSSSEEEKDQEKWHDDPEEQDRDTIAEMESHHVLEEKKKMYEKQQKKMVRRRSSFLDMIRAETEDRSEHSSSSESSSSSSSSESG